MYKVEMLLGKVELDRLQKLRIRIFGNVPVGVIRKEGWTGSIPVYALHCDEHGYVTNYIHGANNLECPICMKRRLNELPVK